MFDELGDAVFRRRYKSLDLNVGVVVGDHAVLVVDTRSTLRQASDFLEELASVTSRHIERPSASAPCVLASDDNGSLK